MMAELSSLARKWPCGLGQPVRKYENKHQILIEAPNEWPKPALRATGG